MYVYLAFYIAHLQRH